MITTSYHREMSLNQWVEMFRDIYFPVQNYGRSALDIFTHLVKVFGAGSHYLFRAHDPKGSREYVAKVFAWYCALVNRLGLDLENVLWQKYPAICPRCRSNVCQCQDPPLEIEPELLTMAAFENSSQRPGNLREWQVMFAKIYRGPSGKVVIPPSRERLAIVFARIAEELGEVAEAITQDFTVDEDAHLVVMNEMADLGAWVFALANNLQYVDESSDAISLADVAWNLYPGKCHRCSEPKCICVKGSYGLELAQKGAMAPSHWDERTGLANDKALRRFLSYANKMYGPGNLSWSVIFLDLDNFGSVNKTYGHEAGDDVLLEAAKRIELAVGATGKAFRRGGEEFVVVMRTHRENALLTAERIRRKLAGTPIIVKGAPETAKLIVTASLGVASAIEDGAYPEGLEPIAERRAREAKTAGKNRVVPEPSKEMLARAWPS